MEMAIAWRDFLLCSFWWSAMSNDLLPRTFCFDQMDLIFIMISVYRYEHGIWTRRLPGNFGSFYYRKYFTLQLWNLHFSWLNWEITNWKTCDSSMAIKTNSWMLRLLWVYLSFRPWEDWINCIHEKKTQVL